MVCIQCIAAPILLIIWRFLIQPLILKWWQYGKKMKCAKEDQDEQPADLVKDCKNGVCTLAWKKTNEDAKKSD